MDVELADTVMFDDAAGGNDVGEMTEVGGSVMVEFTETVGLLAGGVVVTDSVVFEDAGGGGRWSACWPAQSPCRCR